MQFFSTSDNRIKIIQGDCTYIVPRIKEKVHMVFADLPYGTTRCKWDIAIPFDTVWSMFYGLGEASMPIVLFGTQPFTSLMIASNVDNFKFCWTWDKKTGKGHLVANKRPLQQTEDIAVFGMKGRQITYNPIMVPMEKPRILREYKRTAIMGGESDPDYERVTDHKFPKTLLHFPWSPVKTLHEAEKSLDLCKYIIETHSNENDLILDPTCGSGPIAEACLLLNRRCIAIEKDPLHFAAAVDRITRRLS